MVRITRTRIILAALVALILAAGGWLYSRRVTPVAMANYVPESALGYIEVNDATRLLDRLTATTAWEQLAPVYGLPDKLRYAGKLGTLARFTGLGSNEAVLLARSQFAVVVTGIEVRGEEVRPRLAVIAETHSRADSLRPLIDAWLPQLAARAYGQPVREETEYAGVPVTIYRAPDGERRLLSAQLAGEWILANHPDPLRACLDTRQGRTPSMANNFYLRHARPLVDGEGDLFAFVSGPGVVRLLQFGAHLISGGLSATPFAGALEALLAEISARASDGVAYGASFEEGGVVDRYALLFKPEMLDKLQETITVNQGELRALKLVPPSIKDVTLVNVTDPSRALDGIEAAISSQIGAGQSFLLHRFMIGAREALFGLKAGESAAPAIGSEIASFGFTSELADRVLLVAVRDRTLLARLAERYLSPRGATLRRDSYQGIEIINSSDARRGSAAFVGDYLALAARPPLIRLIDAQRRGESLLSAPQFVAASKPPQTAALLSFSSVKEETAEMMTVLTRWFPGAADRQASAAALDQLPLAARATWLEARGVLIEERAPFGNFPFFVSLLGDVVSEVRGSR
jgi:hypothetical protein